ncbi:MAG: hypothetical protein R3B09_34025 [Nannocystaceae bacterium]
MGVRRNLLAVLLVTAGATLLALALVDWIDSFGALLYHVRGR